MKDQKKINDLSTIVSFALKKQVESKKMREKKNEILTKITEMLKSGNINLDELINYADSLQILSEWEKSEKKISESLESKFIVLLIYKLINDKEHLDKIITSFNSSLDELIKETLAWKHYDRAYLIETLYLLRDAVIIGTDNLNKRTVEYLPKVHPFIRDLPEILISYLSSNKSIADLKNAFERYEKFSEENNLLDIWHTIKRLLDLTRVYLRMKGAVSESHDETAEH